MAFPKDFTWGAVASAYQIEGAVSENGRGPSVWDMFCRREGAVWEGHSAEVACDHYHRYREDTALMKQIGLQAYGFSVSWPRVIPRGEGAVNAGGLDFYDRLVDELLAAGITPYVKLFHWDFPYELYCRGGWLNDASSDWFAEYCRAVVNKLSDRVEHWITLIEPQCFIYFGHQTGRHAPGDQLDLTRVLRAAHNVLLAHGKAVKAIRAFAGRECRIGLSFMGIMKVPGGKREEDIEAARSDVFSITKKDVWNNTWWMDPVFLGNYPEDGLKLFDNCVPKIRPADLATIHQPLDFFGMNIYYARRLRAGKDGRPEETLEPSGHPLTSYRWPVTPEALYWAPKFYYERYRLPIVVTENGMANLDWVSVDGRVHDPQRIDFLIRYLRELKRALAEGIDIRGYFCWTIMDNFEWAEGYRERFGLVHVDFATQKRTLKDSAHWYRELIASNGKNL